MKNIILFIEFSFDILTIAIYKSVLYEIYHTDKGSSFIYSLDIEDSVIN